MKTTLSILTIAAIFAFSSCEKQMIEGDLQESPASSKSKEESAMLKSHHGDSMNKGQKVMNFRTHLSGDNEVPSVETDATGQAIFQLSKDGMKLHYKLNVANIKNVNMAHIHLAPAGENGPPVVWLYPSSGSPQLIWGRTQGTLEEGVITKDDLFGQLEGQNLWDLVELIKAGETYVNVHTEQHPAGEIRGQIK